MILVVTGTGTGVGKTHVSAALCALGAATGSVAYLKAAQTGVPADTADIDTVAALAGPSVTLVEGGRFPDPMSPEAAARASGKPAITQLSVLSRARELGATHDLVVIEGAGGLLVRFAPDGWTIADLATELGAAVVVVTGSGLGTLNATSLTLEAMAARGLHLAGLVVSDWPASPGTLELSNLVDLETVSGVRPLLLGSLAAGVAEAAEALRPLLLH